ncbi:DcaP family trimeric outer membrane transporter [Ramlibacter sp. 2FC]|uniref:DcaP family trimeric outer membrane transporter n=1 Tax=Ramlibacter sp. 2FC TaxID=2502188 RepID=UPI0010F7C936|nr:DcaP family trimeric outer membrane transporter [Ramlibacter sp. 2FC]
MKRSFITLLLLASGTLSLPAQAQTRSEFEELRQELQRLRQEINQLKAQQPVPAPAPDAAATAERIEQLELKQKDAVVLGDIPGSFRLPGSETSLRLYGFAELSAVHEAKGDNSMNDYSTFAPYAPINGSTTRTGQSYLHARTSRIGIEASTPTPYGPLAVKVEGDFNNEPRTGNSAVYGTVGNIYTQQATNSYNFRLRHAYGQFGGLLAGQTWSTFMDLDNSPETVDFNGPIGSTFIRQPQVRYAYVTKDLGTFTAAAENSASYVLDSTGVATPAGFSRVPDLIARWDKSFGWGAMSLRGLSHDLRVNGEIAGSNVKASRRGWGLGATALVKMREAKDFASFGLTYGKGIGRYLNYIEGASYDPATNDILLEKALGVVVGYQYKASDSLRANFVLGWQKNYDNAYTAFARANGLDSGQFGVNRRIYQAHLGFIYNPIKNVDLGAEYVLGQRQTLSGEKGDLSRLNLSAKYNFN